MSREHLYEVETQWTGNTGTGTSHYTNYQRSHTIIVKNKPNLLCSSDTPFRGDATKHNPEDLLLSSLSSCHMLWYLHLCADAGIVVEAYVDKAIGRMVEGSEDPGRFVEVILQPTVTIHQASLTELANSLHAEANKKCFIANSVNFPVKHISTCKVLNER